MEKTNTISSKLFSVIEKSSHLFDPYFTLENTKEFIESNASENCAFCGWHLGPMDTKRALLRIKTFDTVFNGEIFGGELSSYSKRDPFVKERYQPHWQDSFDKSMKTVLENGDDLPFYWAACSKCSLNESRKKMEMEQMQLISKSLVSISKNLNSLISEIRKFKDE